MAQQNQSNLNNKPGNNQGNIAGQKGKVMGSDTKNLKSGRIADADASENEDTDETKDKTWGSDDQDEDFDVGTQKNRGSPSKKH